MAEESTDSPVAPEVNDSSRVKLRRNSIAKASRPGNIEDVVVPHYRRASVGSCHDICKYGWKNAFQENEKHSVASIVQRSPLCPSSGEDFGGTKTSLANRRASTGSKLPQKASMVKLRESVDSDPRISITSDTNEKETPTKLPDGQKQGRNEAPLTRKSVVKLKSLIHKKSRTSELPKIIRQGNSAVSAKLEGTSLKPTSKSVETSSKSALELVETSSKPTLKPVRTSSKLIVELVDTSKSKAEWPVESSSKSTIEPVETSPKLTVEPLKTSSKLNGELVGASSKSIVVLIGTSSESIMELVETSSKLNVKPVGTSFESIAEPMGTSSKSIGELVETSSISTLEPVETSSKLIVEAMESSSFSTVEPVVTSSESIMDPVETPSISILEPVESSSKSTLEPVETSPKLILEPVETSSIVTAELFATSSESSMEAVETSSISVVELVESSSKSSGELVQTASKPTAEPSKSTAKKVDASSKSTAKQVEASLKSTPKKAEASRKSPAEKVEASPKSTSKKVETSSKSSTKRVETTSKLAAKKVETSPKSSDKKVETSTNSTAKAVMPMESTAKVGTRTKSTAKKVVTPTKSTAKVGISSKVVVKNVVTLPKSTVKKVEASSTSNSMVGASSKPTPLKAKEMKFSEKHVASLRSNSVTAKTIPSLNVSEGASGQSNSKPIMDRQAASLKAAARKLMMTPSRALLPSKSSLNDRIVSINARKHKSLKIASHLKNQLKTRKYEHEEPSNDEVAEKTLYVIKMESGKKTLQSGRDASYDVEFSPPQSLSPPKFSSSSLEDKEESEYTASEGKEDSFSVNFESELMENGEALDRKVAIVSSEDKVNQMSKLNFRGGKFVELQSEITITTPRRLKFRRATVFGENSNFKAENLRRSFKRRYETGIDRMGTPSGPEEVVLRRQGGQGKRDAHGLFNNVIEETANKLAEIRKSKVKALVGAFETVISLQERKRPVETIS